MRAALAFLSAWAVRARPVAPAAPPTKLFVAGLGYCGIRTAIAWHEAYPECEVHGSVRSRAKAEVLKARFPWFKTHTFDLDENYVGLDEPGRAALATASHLVQTMPPIADFDRDPLLALHGDLLRESEPLVSAAYLSSTGVYGDHGGDWVDEDSELRPDEPRSRARVVAEAAWMELEERPGRPRCTVSVFRLGGLYGPGRSPLGRARLQGAQSPLVDSGSTVEAVVIPWVNRVHVDDVAGALVVAATRAPGPARVYNLVDDEPAPRSAVVSLARRLLGLSEDVQADGAASLPPARPRRARSSGSKRVRNARLRGELAYELTAPTYREGLELLLEAEQAAADNSGG